MTTIFLAGASRGVGREVARCLLAQNLTVIALLRSEATRPELEAMGVQVVLGDALDPGAVEQAMSQAPVDAVISTIGGKPTDGERSDFLGNKHLTDAAVKVGAKKFVLVTSIGSGNSAPALPPRAMEALAPVLAEKAQAENHLIASGLAYTIIRPGGLTSDPPRGEGILTENPLVAGTIHRADVAELVCRCLMSDRANQKILSAVDRNKLFAQTDFEAFIP